MLTGYRWWWAAEQPQVGLRLRSIAMQPAVWWDGPHLVAASSPSRGDGGIHAFRSADLAWHAAREFARWAIVGERRAEHPVWGEVRLWGRVVEHELGYRAEHAMINRLVVPDCLWITGLGRRPLRRNYRGVIPRDCDVDELGRRYGADIEIGDSIEIAVEPRSPC